MHTMQTHAANFQTWREPREVALAIMSCAACEIVGGMLAIGAALAGLVGGVGTGSTLAAGATLAIATALLAQGAVGVVRRRATAHRAYAGHVERDRARPLRAELLAGAVGIALGLGVVAKQWPVAMLGAAAIGFGIVMFVAASRRHELGQALPGESTAAALRASSTTMTAAGLCALGAGLAVMLGVVGALPILLVAAAAVGVALVVAGGTLAVRFAA